MSNYSNLSVAVSAAMAVMDDDEFANITIADVRDEVEHLREQFQVSDEGADLVVRNTLTGLLAS